MKHTLQDKIKKFQQYMSELLPYTTLSESELLRPENKEKLHTTERLFQLMVDEAIDINTELIRLKSDKIPDTYRNTFTDLAPIGVLEHHFADKISVSVRIRNHIVHEYEDIKVVQMIRFIKKFTEMYKEYIKIIIAEMI